MKDHRGIAATTTEMNTIAGVRGGPPGFGRSRIVTRHHCVSDGTSSSPPLSSRQFALSHPVALDAPRALYTGHDPVDFASSSVF